MGIAKANIGLVTRWLCEGEWISRAVRRKPHSCLSRFVRSANSRRKPVRKFTAHVSVKMRGGSRNGMLERARLVAVPVLGLVSQGLQRVIDPFEKELVVEAKRSENAGRQGRRQPGRSRAGKQVGLLFEVEGSNKSRASARASQPASSQSGGQDGSLWTSGNQRNGVIASSSLWQSGL